ncbi:MAG: DUF1559 domain-containing protein [Planctomycetaceae bacterium]
MRNNPFDAPEAADVATASPKPGGCMLRLWKLLVVVTIILILILLLLPATRRSPTRQAARRMQCKNNLKQIGLALHIYHDVYGSFPPAYTVDEDGRPLHSWRTLILPYLEEAALYNSIDLLKPWNHPDNSVALEAMPEAYACPSVNFDVGHTTYLALNGPECIFNGATPRQLTECQDGTPNTIAVAEFPNNQSVPWMAPQDAGIATFIGLNDESETAHTGGFQVLILDGSVHYVSNTLDVETRKALATIAGAEKMGEW